MVGQMRAGLRLISLTEPLQAGSECGSLGIGRLPPGIWELKQGPPVELPARHPLLVVWQNHYRDSHGHGPSLFLKFKWG